MKKALYSLYALVCAAIAMIALLFGRDRLDDFERNDEF